MSDTLDTAALAAGPLKVAVERHAELGSTNDRARELIVSGGALPALVIADLQTSGRGRGVNKWWSSDGALTFSLAIDAAARGLSLDQNRLLSLAVAVAVVDAVRVTTGLSAGVKWPNDVYLHDKKVAGILIESPQPGRLVIGVGINVANRFDDAPDGVRARAASLVEYAATTRQAVLTAFLEAFDIRLTQTSAGDASLMESARMASVLTGKTVTLRDGGRVVTGECVGFADDGALLLSTGGAVASCYAGTIENAIE